MKGRFRVFLREDAFDVSCPFVSANDPIKPSRYLVMEIVVALFEDCQERSNFVVKREVKTFLICTGISIISGSP